MERVGLGMFVILSVLFVFVAGAGSQVAYVGGVVSGSSADFSGGTVVQGENKVVHSTGAVVLESTNHVAGADRSGWFTFNFNATPKVNVSEVDLVVVSSEDIQAEVDVLRNATRAYNTTNCVSSIKTWGNGTVQEVQTCTVDSVPVTGFGWSLVKGTELWGGGKKEVRFGPFTAKKDVPVEAQVRIRNFPRGNVYKFDFCLVPSGVNLSFAKDNGLGGCLDPSAQGSFNETIWLDCGGSPVDKATNHSFTAVSMTYNAGHHGNGGCSFDGTNGYLWRTMEALLDFNQSYTLNLWIRNDNYATQGYTWYQQSGSGGLLINFLEDGNGRKYRIFHNPGYIDSGSLISNAGVWEMWTVVFNGTHIVRYRNTTADTPVAFGNVISDSGDAFIGFRSTCGIGTCKLAGNISDYRWYNFSLNSTEVSLLFDGGNGSNKSLALLVNPPAPPPFVLPQVNVSIINRTSSNASVILASEHVWSSANYSHASGLLEANSTFKWYVNDSNSSSPSGKSPHLKAMIYKDAVAYWHLDENGGAGGYADSSGKGNSGVPNGGLANVSGVINGAVSFDGVNDYVNVSDSGSLDIAGQISVAAWFYPRSITSGASIVRKGPGANGVYYFYVSADSYLRFAINDIGWDGGGYLLPSANAWYHVVGTYNGSVKNLYVNGVLQNFSYLTGAIAANNFGLTFGQSGDGGEWFNGTVDEVAVYNRSLSPSEIRQLYLRSWYDYGPEVLLAHMDNSSSGLVNATLMGSHSFPAIFGGGVNCTTSVTGYYGQACQFDGVNDYLNVSSVGASLNDLTTAATWEAWVYPNQVGGSVITKWFAGGGTGGDWSLILHPNGAVRTILYNGTARLDQSGNSGVVAAGVWQYVAAVYNGTGVAYYVNGIQQGTSAGPIGPLYSTLEPVVIGARTNGTADFFNGSIDEIRVSRKVLTAQEINESFSKGRPFFSNEYLLNSSNYGAGDTLKLEYSPRDSNGTVGVAQNSSGLSVHALKMAGEAEGGIAIELGINSSLPSATKYSFQQVYIRNLSNNQVLGRFDWVASFGSQRWLLNYITTGESYVMAPNLTTAVYVLEITDKTSSQITDEVSRFINATK